MYYTFYLVIPVEVKKDADKVAVSSQRGIDYTYESVDDGWHDTENLNGNRC